MTMINETSAHIDLRLSYDGKYVRASNSINEKE